MTKLDPKTTALLLIEFQNEFTTKGGKLHDAVAPVMDETKMLGNAVKVAKEMRAKGCTVMHAPITFVEGFNEITSHPYGILKGVVDGKAFVKGTWGADFADAMKPDAKDIVIEGKRGLDTFASTNLDFILRSKGIKNLVIAGFLTNCCVESTMRTAYEHGFNVITLNDCCAATSKEAHVNALQFDFPMFSTPMGASDVLAQIG